MKTLRSVWSEHPLVDLVPLAIIVVAVSFLAPVLGPGIPPETALEFLGSVAGVSGLAFAAGTFVCTMTYQSTNFLMSDLRKSHHTAIRRNWVMILASLLLSGIAACLVMLLVPWSVSVAVAVGVVLTAIIGFESVRAIWWLKQTLFIEDAAKELPERVGYDKRLLKPKH